MQLSGNWSMHTDMWEWTQLSFQSSHNLVASIYYIRYGKGLTFHIHSYYFIVFPEQTFSLKSLTEFSLALDLQSWTNHCASFRGDILFPCSFLSVLCFLQRYSQATFARMNMITNMKNKMIIQKIVSIGSHSSICSSPIGVRVSFTLGKKKG